MVRNLSVATQQVLCGLGNRHPPDARTETQRRRRGGRNVIIQAFLAVFLLDVGFRVFGFPRVFLFVNRWGRRSVDAAPLGIQRRRRRRTVEAVRTAGRYYHRRRLNCLSRSLAIYVLLRRQGVPATLRIGVKRYPFAAHAWVECLGEVLDDSIDDWRHEPYVPILTTGERL